MFKLNQLTKQVDSLIIATLGLLVIIRGYAVLNPIVLQFVKNRQSIPVQEQATAAMFFTLLLQGLSIYFLGCCFWSLKKFKVGDKYFLNPILYGAFGFIFFAGIVFVVFP